MEVRFINPPNRSGTTYDWNRVVTDLKQQPGRWALLATEERVSIANAVRNGSIALMKGVKVSTRNNHLDEHGIRRCDIYLKWPRGKN